jgi:basic membrane lipoprotein Med (substrate-binding protein (PBP1-ABC) superfamily)
MVIIIIVVCIIVITLIAVFAFGSHILSSTTNDLSKWAKKIEKDKAKKDAQSIIKLGYIVDQKWFDKTYNILSNNPDDLEAKLLWEKLSKLKYP